MNIHLAIIFLGVVHQAETSGLAKAVLRSRTISEIIPKLKASREPIETVEDVPDKLLKTILSGQGTDYEWKALHHYSKIDDAGASLELLRSCFNAVKKSPLVFYNRFLAGDKDALNRMVDAISYDFSAYEKVTKASYRSHNAVYQNVLAMIRVKSSSSNSVSKLHDQFVKVSRLHLESWKSRYLKEIAQ